MVTGVQHQTTSSAHQSCSEGTYSTANGTGNSSTQPAPETTPVVLKDITAKDFPSIGEKALHTLRTAGKTIQLDNLPPEMRKEVAEAVKDQPYAQKGAGHAKLVDLPPALAKEVLAYKNDIDTHGAASAKAHQAEIKGETIQLDNLPPDVRKAVAKAVEGQPYAEKGAGFAKLEDMPPALSRQVLDIKNDLGDKKEMSAVLAHANSPEVKEAALHNINMAGKTIQLDNLPPEMRKEVAEAVKDQPYAQKGAGHAKLVDLPPALAKEVLAYKNDIQTHGAADAKAHQAEIKGETIQLDNLPPDVRKAVAKAVEGQPYAEKGAGFARLEDMPPALSRQVLDIKNDVANQKIIDSADTGHIVQQAQHNITMAGKTIQLDNLPPEMRKEVAEAVKDQPYAQKGAGHAKLVDLPPALAKEILAYKNDIDTHGAASAKAHQAEIKGETIQLDNLPPDVRKAVAKAVEGQPYAEKGAGFARLEDMPPALSRQVLDIKNAL